MEWTIEQGFATPPQARHWLEDVLMSDQPSRRLTELREAGQLLPWFPELADLIGVQQSPVHHAEGDVWVHTLMVLDVSVEYRSQAKDPLGFMLAALTHDFGKAVCTEVIDGQIHSYEHEIRGLPLTEAFLERLGVGPGRMAYVCNLARYHMLPNALAAQGASIKSSNRMFDQSADPLALVCLATADGRGKRSTRPYISYEEELHDRLATYYEYLARPQVTEQELREAGITAPDQQEACLQEGRKLMLSGVDHRNCLAQAIAFARQQGYLPPKGKKKKHRKKAGPGAAARQKKQEGPAGCNPDGESV